VDATHRRLHARGRREAVARRAASNASTTPRGGDGSPRAAADSGSPRWQRPTLSPADRVHRRMLALVAIGDGRGGLDAAAAPGRVTFDEMFGRTDTATGAWTPSVDVSKTRDAIVYSFDLPGLSPDDVRIELQNGMLLVSGERKEETEEQHEGYFVRARSFGSFARSFTLPQGVGADDVKAEFADGVLKVSVPLPEETKPRRIPLVSKAKQLVGVKSSGSSQP
jgi:HSP20 family protein